MAKTQDIELVDLLINTENYRFESVESQKDSIDQMISDQKLKLYELAKDILIYGLNPNDRIQVVASNHSPGKYNVLEGNRRTIALKIINNPDLIEGPAFSVLRRKFTKLKEEYKDKLITEIECTVYDNPTEADKWIKLKHSGQGSGAGLVGWNSQQIQRFEEKVEGKSSIALQIIKVLKSSPNVPNEIKKDLNKLKTTNLIRLVSDPDVRKKLGIEVSNGTLYSDIKEKEVVKGLIQVVKHIQDPTFSVKNIYTKADRKDYINNFPKRSTPNIDEKATKKWSFNDHSNSIQNNVETKVKSNPVMRDRLIPGKFHLQISNPKVNAIYHELKKMSISKYTNAVSISLRVFVELSMDCFLEHYDKSNYNTNIDKSLKAKIDKVAEYMEENNFAHRTVCKGIRSATNKEHGLLGIKTWHAYVHNSKFSPIASDLTITWDNIQDFVGKVWESIK